MFVVTTPPANRGECYISRMERIVIVYPTHDAAAAADRDALRRLSPQARLDRLLHMQQTHRKRLGDAGRGLARVARIVDRPRR